MRTGEAEEVISGWTEEQKKHWNKVANEDITAVMKSLYVQYVIENHLRRGTPEAHRLLEVFEAFFNRLDEIPFVEKISMYDIERIGEENKSVLSVEAKASMFSQAITNWKLIEKRIKEEVEYLEERAALARHYEKNKQKSQYKHNTKYGPHYTDGKKSGGGIKPPMPIPKKKKKEMINDKIRF